MHPVEQLGYLGVAFWHLIIPSNPILALYQLHFAGFAPSPVTWGSKDGAD